MDTANTLKKYRQPAVLSTVPNLLLHQVICSAEGYRRRQGWHYLENVYPEMGCLLIIKYANKRSHTNEGVNGKISQKTKKKNPLPMSDYWTGSLLKSHYQKSPGQWVFPIIFQGLSGVHCLINR